MENRSAWLGMTVLLLGGCGGGDTVTVSNGNITVPVPSDIRQIAAIETSALELEIAVNEQAPVSVPNQGADVWSAQVDIPENQSNEVLLAWYTNVDGSRLLLADFAATVSSQQEELSVSNYSTQGARFDNDGDDRSNLLELRENRNPLDRIDLTIPFSEATFLSPSIGVSPINDAETSGDDIGDVTGGSQFSVWHDGQFLKFLVCVRDEAVFSDGGNPDSPFFEYWHDDGVEIYIDAGNDATPNSPFDTQNDFQFVYTPDPTQSGSYTNAVNLSNDSGNRPICPDGTCSTHTFRATANCAYELAAQLDMSALGLTSGSEFGLDIELTDDDNGGLREAKYAWIGVENDSFLRPYSFAKVQLE